MRGLTPVESTGRQSRNGLAAEAAQESPTELSVLTPEPDTPPGGETRSGESGFPSPYLPTSRYRRIYGGETVGESSRAGAERISR